MNEKVINVIGAYVGLVTAVGLASMKHKVILTDNDALKIENLNDGVIPIYEPGLQDVFDHA